MEESRKHSVAHSVEVVAVASDCFAIVARQFMVAAVSLP